MTVLRADRIFITPPPFEFERSASRLMFVVPGCPVPWQRAGRTKSGRYYTRPESARYKRSVKALAMLALDAGPAPKLVFDVDRSRFRVHVRSYFPNKRKRDSDRVSNNVRDALVGVLWRDDDWTRVTGTDDARLDRERPRTVILVETIEGDV